MDERFVAATAGPRLLTGVLVTFAVLTAILAAIGVYGLLAWTVNERRRELAIRLALGAQPGALARLVTAQGLMLATARRRRSAWPAPSSRADCCRTSCSRRGPPTCWR